MGDTVISVRGLGKRYVLGEELSFDLLQERVAHGIRRLFGRGGKGSGESREFWALRDVEFDVREGEVLGVIGRNGAGKSTLLKILSRITDPTEGEVRIRGRVASLLEVGTGFHKELTGRENVYLNGAILGMGRAEIRGKFDEIVQFAGVEKFIDTPVKRYSSGMTVRLAFSVAAHLEPEVLLIDEVLAVGDAEFQKRCIGKMEAVARGGRTILFVSHNMAAIEGLCDRAILLEAGKLAATGPFREIVPLYLGEGAASGGDVDLSPFPRPRGIYSAVLSHFRILDHEGRVMVGIDLGGEATFEVSGSSEERLDQVALNIRVDGHLGHRVTVFHTGYQHPASIHLRGSFAIRCRLLDCRLMPGTYRATLILKCGGKVVDEVGPVPFQVLPRDIYGTGQILPSRVGDYLPDVRWEIRQ